EGTRRRETPGPAALPVAISAWEARVAPTHPPRQERAARPTRRRAPEGMRPRAPPEPAARARIRPALRGGVATEPGTTTRSATTGTTPTPTPARRTARA